MEWIHDRSGGQVPRTLSAAALFCAAMACAGCQPVRHPPPTTVFDGLPVSGTISDARRAGFTECFNMDAIHMRCRRHAVMVEGIGPYEAAIDLQGGDGEGGFDQLVLWHTRDNYAPFRIADMLERTGWRYCYTGDDVRGDQAIYTRKGSPVWLSMDLSYYAKRRMRVLPNWNRPRRGCVPA